MKAKDFDEKFDENQTDIIGSLNLSTLKRPNQQQKRVNVDFPVWVIASLDKEASALSQLNFRVGLFNGEPKATTSELEKPVAFGSPLNNLTIFTTRTLKWDKALAEWVFHANP